MKTAKLILLFVVLASAPEVVTSMLYGDEWRVAGYYIR